MDSHKGQQRPALILRQARHRYDFDNVQVQQLDTKTITFKIGNAAKSHTTSVELEFEWLAAERLSLRDCGRQPDDPGRPRNREGLTLGEGF